MEYVKYSTSLKNYFKFNEILVFLQKFNPYRETITDDNGVVKEASYVLYYRGFVRWFFDICLNGVFANLIFWAWRKQPLNPYLALVNGITVWFCSVLLEKLWNSYVAGKVTIARNTK